MFKHQDTTNMTECIQAMNTFEHYVVMLSNLCILLLARGDILVKPLPIYRLFPRLLPSFCHEPGDETTW